MSSNDISDECSTSYAMKRLRNIRLQKLYIKIEMRDKQKLTLGDVLSNNLGRSNAKKITRLTRESPFDHHNPKVVVNLHNLQLSYLLFSSSHSPGHFLSFVHTSRSCSCPYGTKCSMALGSMSHQTPFEVVSLDTTLLDNQEIRC